jgi:hypothetical protein
MPPSGTTADEDLFSLFLRDRPRHSAEEGGEHDHEDDFQDWGLLKGGWHQLFWL